AEAMTLFAVVCAGIFPAVHVGRIWMVWFLAPVPNSNAIWQNFRSPLLWDVFAVSTYFTVSVLFWYTGLIPDLATLRDRATNKLRKFFYGVAALGWRGGNRQWKHYEMAYLVLAGLSTPLVLSVHSVVSFDFATSVIPGWHTTIFPPYFVAGAIFGGFAMVLTIMLPARAIFGLHDLITDDHVDKMCKIILLTGSIVGYAYAMEFFIAWYGGNMYEQYAFINRATGPYWWAYWSMIFCNVVAPQLFWFRFFRRHVLSVFIVCMFVNAGMWFERFVIIVTSLHRDFLPSSWGMFYPTWVDIWTFVGTFGIFLSLFLVFIRWLPMICIFEVKAVLPEADPHHGQHDGHAAAPAKARKEGAH
ncbi:MAG: NrfD/PsrC family molybdoenzyme membrane anchor subunit, partial [Chthoniobacterales bacterium]